MCWQFILELLHGLCFASSISHFEREGNDKARNGRGNYFGTAGRKETCSLTFFLVVVVVVMHLIKKHYRFFYACNFFAHSTQLGRGVNADSKFLLKKGLKMFHWCAALPPGRTHWWRHLLARSATSSLLSRTLNVSDTETTLREVLLNSIYVNR